MRMIRRKGFKENDVRPHANRRWSVSGQKWVRPNPELSSRGARPGFGITIPNPAIQELQANAEFSTVRPGRRCDRQADRQPHVRLWKAKELPEPFRGCSEGRSPTQYELTKPTIGPMQSLFRPVRYPSYVISGNDRCKRVRSNASELTPCLTR